MFVREGASNDNARGIDDSTVVHATDELGDPMCGINPGGTEPWFGTHQGGASDVTCTECLDAMQNTFA